MVPGTILFDNDFAFSDGSRGRKLLVVLNDGENGSYIVVKTTSNSAYKGNTFGCQNEDRYPNFYLPDGSCCLKGQSWVQIDQYFEFSAAEFLGWHFSGRINRIGVLPTEIALQLLRCAVESEDITAKQQRLLQEAVSVLQKSPT